MPSLYKALYCTLLFTHQYTDYSVFLSHFILLTVATSRKAKDKKKKEKKKKKRKKKERKKERRGNVLRKAHKTKELDETRVQVNISIFVS